jgi:hypothetical protein
LWDQSSKVCWQGHNLPQLIATNTAQQRTEVKTGGRTKICKALDNTASSSVKHKKTFQYSFLKAVNSMTNKSAVYETWPSKVTSAWENHCGCCKLLQHKTSSDWSVLSKW